MPLTSQKLTQLKSMCEASSPLSPLLSVSATADELEMSISPAKLSPAGLVVRETMRLLSRYITALFVAGAVTSSGSDEVRSFQVRRMAPSASTYAARLDPDSNIVGDRSSSPVSSNRASSAMPPPDSTALAVSLQFKRYLCNRYASAAGGAIIYSELRHRLKSR